MTYLSGFASGCSGISLQDVPTQYYVLNEPVSPPDELPIYETHDADGDGLEAVFEPNLGTIYVRSGPHGTDLSLEQAFEFAVRLQAICVAQLDFQAAQPIEGE